MCNVIQRSSHPLYQAFYFFQHRIEERHQLVKLVTRVIGRYAGVHPAGRYRSYCGNEAPKRAESAMREQTSPGNAQHNDRKHETGECLAKPLEKGRLFSRLLADL